MVNSLREIQVDSGIERRGEIVLCWLIFFSKTSKEIRSEEMILV